VKARPDARFIYLADDAGFPYGNLAESVLIARVIVCSAAPCPTQADMSWSHATQPRRWRSPNCVRVLQCSLSARCRPSSQPARIEGRRVAVLSTQATVDRGYTRALIREFASGCDVHLVGSSHLAGFAEAELAGEPAKDTAIKQEIAGCFVESDARRTDTIVLACTHYPLLLDRFRTSAPWPVTWLDPAPAIARRVADLMRDRNAGEPAPLPQIVFTSGRSTSPQLGAPLANFGF
jgi:glutamate racemase